MSQSIETQLRAALDEATESIQPSADLADRVRRATRRRRRALISAIAVGLVAVTVGYLIAVHAVGVSTRHPTTNHRAKQAPGWQWLTQYGTPNLLAVSGRRLYVAVDDHGDSSLIAYDLTTGRLIRRVSIPAVPSAVRIGPSGRVWLGFYPDSNGGGTGVWLLSPDLRLRSGVNLGTRRYFGAAPFDVLPTGADTAVLATSHGLAVLRMPEPGQTGPVRLRWEPPVPGAHRILGVAVQIASFAGRVAVRVQNDSAYGLITFPEPGSPAFRPSPADSVGGIAAGAHGLWTTIFTRNGDVTKGLLRLNDQLKPDTPRSVSRNRLLADAQQAAALGDAVWVILAGSPSLACFPDQGAQIGPVTTLRTRHAPTGGLAVVGTTLYVLSSFGVDSYRVPAACH